MSQSQELQPQRAEMKEHPPLFSPWLVGWLVGWIYLKSYNKQAYLPPDMKTTSGSKTL